MIKNITLKRRIRYKQLVQQSMKWVHLNMDIGNIVIKTGPQHWRRKDTALLTETI